MTAAPTPCQPMVEQAICTLCAKLESPGFYTGCMINDGACTDSGWQCDGNGNLTRAALNREAGK